MFICMKVLPSCDLSSRVVFARSREKPKYFLGYQGGPTEPSVWRHVKQLFGKTIAAGWSSPWDGLVLHRNTTVRATCHRSGYSVWRVFYQWQMFYRDAAQTRHSSRSNSTKWNFTVLSEPHVTGNIFTMLFPLHLSLRGTTRRVFILVFVASPILDFSCAKVMQFNIIFHFVTYIFFQFLMLECKRCLSTSRRYILTKALLVRVYIL